jgi:phage-related protein
MDEKSERRPLFWEGSSKRDFKQFPTAVQKDMGVALFVVQLGGTPPSAKPWTGLVLLSQKGESKSRRFAG